MTPRSALGTVEMRYRFLNFALCCGSVNQTDGSNSAELRMILGMVGSRSATLLAVRKYWIGKPKQKYCIVGTFATRETEVPIPYIFSKFRFVSGI